MNNMVIFHSCVKSPEGKWFGMISWCEITMGFRGENTVIFCGFCPRSRRPDQMVGCGAAMSVSRSCTELEGDYFFNIVLLHGTPNRAGLCFDMLFSIQMASQKMGRFHEDWRMKQWDTLFLRRSHLLLVRPWILIFSFSWLFVWSFGFF